MSRKSRPETPILAHRLRKAGGWEIVIKNRKAMVAALGEPLLAAFCRCFVHADRLNGLNALIVLSLQSHGQDTVSHMRNMNLIFWQVIGTLLEFQRATEDLASALRKSGLHLSKLEGWKSVQELRKWTREPLLRRLRNKISSHVDPGEVAKGVSALKSRRADWLFARGDDEFSITHEFLFGFEALLKGLAISRRDLYHLMKGAKRRQFNLPGDLQKVFVSTLEQKGACVV